MVTIEYTAEFKRNIRQLSKKYRSIQSDVQNVIDELQSGNFLGEQVPGIGFTIYKVRVRNSDNQKGKSAGYRIIYFLKQKSSIILVTIYSKSEQSDISTKEIKNIGNCSAYFFLISVFPKKTNPPSRLKSKSGHPLFKGDLKQGFPLEKGVRGIS